MSVRVLCLGNELLADDSFGSVVAKGLRAMLGDSVDVVATPVTGFDLLDHLENTSLLVVVDTVLSGKAAPGTVFVLREEDLHASPGGSPHYIGLQEPLALARKLRLPAPEKVVFVVVEAADCTTVGGAMHPAVRAAVPLVANLVDEILRTPANMNAARRTTSSS